MAKNKKQLLYFDLVKINTLQFAVIEEMYKETSDSGISLSYTVGIGAEKDSKILHFNIKSEFKQGVSPFLIIEVECDFAMSDKAWDDIFNHELQSSVVVPKNLAIHLAGITISIARGILHTKTEGTRFNKFIIKAIPVANIIPEDVEINFSKKQKPKKVSPKTIVKKS